MSYSVDNVTDKPKSREERIKDFVRAIAAVEQAMLPFKEQKSDLKKNYVENDWLSKEDLRYVTRAYNLAKRGDFDLDKFIEAFEKVK
jgi:hypothetical protein